MTRKRKRRRLWRLLLLLLLFRLWLDNFTVITREYDVSSAAIPGGFNGFRIAQISDLHGNRLIGRKLAGSLRAAEPDIIVLTGDLTDAEDEWESLEPLLRELAALAPCYYVSGNHEWADVAAEPLFRRIAETGVTVLRNEWVTLECGGDTLVLAGIEDPNGYADMLTPDGLFERIRAETDDYIVALCHRPGMFPALAKLGFGFVLSGHNHGGLIRLPFAGGLVSPSGFLPEYDKGLFAAGGSRMLVSPGLSGVSLCPRLFNRPEVPVAVLRSE